jgi:hypothetical protein
MRIAIIPVLLLAAASSAAADPNFDPAKLCQWQNENNGMDVTECMKLEEDGKSAVEAAAADKARMAVCDKEAGDFAKDSGFASYAIYADCLKKGPGKN